MKIKVNKYLIGIVILSIFLGLYKIQTLMPFIGDQGWFYVSARDLTFSNNFPLVGITASHTWLHQGALWTYILAPFLFIFKSNPISGVYLSITFQVISIVAIYFLTRALFKKQSIGLIAALLFATSPLLIIYSRMPYHTSPISFFTIIFIYSIFLYAKGKTNFLILGSLMLGVLYGLELATMAFWIIPLIVILITKKINLRIIILCFLAFAIPNIPMIIFDFQQRTGFYQITAFPRLIKISIFDSAGFYLNSYLSVIEGLLIYNQQFIFASTPIVSSIIVLFSFVYSFRIWILKRKKKEYGLFLILIWILISFAAILFSKTASEAYLPMILPGVIILIAFTLGQFTKTSAQKIIVSLVLILIIGTNIYQIVSTNYFTNSPDFISFEKMKSASKEIVEISDNKKYNLVRVGNGSEYKDNFKNYEYLTWFYGNGPSNANEKIKIIIEEKKGKIFIKKNED